jgi:hypothetical protein
MTAVNTRYVLMCISRKSGAGLPSLRISYLRARVSRLDAGMKHFLRDEMSLCFVAFEGGWVESR